MTTYILKEMVEFRDRLRVCKDSMKVIAETLTLRPCVLSAILKIIVEGLKF